MSESKVLQLNRSILEYLEGLNLGGPMHARIRDLADVFQLIAGCELDRLFVTDVGKPGESAIYESLWGFAGPYWMEARDFVSTQDIDISPYKNHIKYLGIQYTDVTLPSEYASDSWMQVEVATEKVTYSTLLATGQNCLHLYSLFSELLRPSLIP